MRDPQTHAIIGAAIEVHRHFGPGLIERVYEASLCHEFIERKIPFFRQAAIPLTCKGLDLALGFRAAFIVEDSVLIEMKCVEKLINIHDAQILTYLKLAHIKKGLLINFNSQPLIDGIKRFIL